MVTIYIKFTGNSVPVQIICDNFSEIFNHLERSSDVEAYRAFNEEAQFLPKFGYVGYKKLVQAFEIQSFGK